MEIQVLKTELRPKRILIQDRIIFLITDTVINIIDLKGNIIPDIDLKNIKVYVKASRNEYVATNDKFVIHIETLHLYKKNLIILSTTQNLYFCKMGENEIYQIDIRADKVCCNKRLFVLKSDTIFEIKIKNKKVKILPMIFHVEKINDFIQTNRRIIFQAGRSTFIAKSNNRFRDCTDDENGYFDSKKGIVTKTLHAFDNVLFESMVANDMFFLLETNEDIITFSANTYTIILKKPDVFYSCSLVGSYIFVFSEKIIIYSAITGEKMRELPMTAFRGSYDQESGLMLLQNERIFITDVVRIINKIIFVNRKELETKQEDQKSAGKKNPKNWIKSFLVQKKIYPKQNQISEKIRMVTPQLNLINFKTAIENKLYVIARKIDQKETFLHCSLDAFRDKKISRGLFFYARSGKKYNFDRKKVVENCKNGIIDQEITFYYHINKKLNLKMDQLIYFLAIRTVYMKTEMNFLFFISVHLKMVKYISYILDHLISSEKKLKTLEKIDLNSNFRSLQKDNNQKIPSQISLSVPARCTQPSVQAETSYLEKVTIFLSKKRLKRRVIEYWKIMKPEKAVLYYTEKGKFRKASKILFESHAQIKNLKDLLSKISLYEKVTNVPLIGLYNAHFPNLLALLAKANTKENMVIYITQIVDVLANTQQIYKTVSKMDNKSKENFRNVLTSLNQTESIKMLLSTIEILCNDMDNSERPGFECDGKVID
ncbi:hypothetical protein M153_1990007491 [Pseudoloma neurophilia]|uniref:Uncharacterized protein n=1 Tax=Pseudoloma neurophilia TaxID=146866 RepID=A0A0R0LZA7_9MICR|nr:hypothetical protein M153_1990007491 [Pseudoloma neurophilia]